MPIEIRELVIRAQVEPNHNGSERHSEARSSLASQNQDEIIRACVEEVLRVLEQKQER